MRQTDQSGDSTCVSWVKLHVYEGINVCSTLSLYLSPSLSLSLAFIPSAGHPPALHLGSERVHIFIYKSWNSHFFHLAYLVTITASFICFFLYSLWLSLCHWGKMSFHIMMSIFHLRNCVAKLDSAHALLTNTYDISKISLSLCLSWQCTLCSAAGYASLHTMNTASLLLGGGRPSVITQ